MIFWPCYFREREQTVLVGSIDGLRGRREPVASRHIRAKGFNRVGEKFSCYSRDILKVIARGISRYNFLGVVETKRRNICVLFYVRFA